MKTLFIILISFFFSTDIFPQTTDSTESKDTVKISKDITTPEIKVEAQKEFMRVEDDKTIIDISKLPGDPGPNALELMKRIPMVSVENENVLLRGGTPKILINGRESQMYGDLKSLSSDMVESVEIMTIVPSKYEAEGVSGVINIVLKKFEDAKYRGFLSSNLSSNNSIGSYIDANYKKNKFSFFLNTHGNFFKAKSENYYYTKDISLNEITSSSTDTIENSSKGFRINPGIIYDAAPTLYLGVEGVYDLMSSDYNADITRQYSYLGNQHQFFLNNGNFKNNNYSLLVYLNKKEIFKKDELNLEFNLNNTSNNSDYLQEEFINNSFKPFYKTVSGINNNNYTVKFDYSKKISDAFRFETGARDNFKKEVNDFSYADTSAGGSSNYEFIQKIYSYYGTLTYVWETFRIKPGLRIEYADLKGIVNASSEFTNYKLDVFPTITLTKFFTDDTQLQFSYGKRIERPRFNSLNPFPINRDVHNTVTGNPDLQPSYSHSFEFKINKPIGTNYFNLSSYFKHNSNLIQTIRNIDSIYTRTTYINNGYLNEYGIDGGINLNYAQFFYLNFSGGINKKIYSDDSLNALSDRVYYSWRAYAGYGNPDVINVNVFVNYMGRRYSPFNISEPNVSFFLTISKSFLDKKLNTSVNLNNPFTSFNRENRYINSGYEQYSNSSGNFSNLINFYISYTFGNYDEKRKKGKDIESDSYGD